LLLAHKNLRINLQECFSFCGTDFCRPYGFSPGPHWGDWWTSVPETLCPRHWRRQL